MRNIYDLRKRIGISQVDIAKEIGISRFSLIDYEKGRTFPPLDVAQRLAGFFNVSLDELLNGPQQQTFNVTLKYEKTLEGGSNEMNMNGITLTISEDGFVGVSGGKRYPSSGTT